MAGAVDLQWVCSETCFPGGYSMLPADDCHTVTERNVWLLEGPGLSDMLEDPCYIEIVPCWQL
jgi:hypothetical protein